jgi:hypothetical protein
MSLLPSEPSTPPTPHMSALDMLEMLTTHTPMLCTPIPSMLADMQSLVDAYLYSAYLHTPLQHLTASYVLPPYWELWRLGAGMRSCSLCAHYHCWTGIVSLHGCGLGIWHWTIFTSCTSHVSPEMQRGTETHVCIGHLWQIVGLPVWVVMRPHTMMLMMVTHSILCCLSWRT